MLTVARTATGEHVDISTLAVLKERHEPRPTCFCLACGRRLAAKLGQVRAHHFGHFPETGPDRCWATSPEGALHINAKALLRRLLEAACAEGRALHVARRCPRCGRGSPVLTEIVRLNPSDTVLVEGWADPRRSFRPDLQVLGATGEPRLFVEVVVTNSSSDDKLRWARSLAVPLLELQGAAALRQEESSSILECSSAFNLPPRALCVACAEATLARAARATVQAGREEGTHIREAKSDLDRPGEFARRGATPLDLSRIAEGVEARTKRLDAEECRRKALLPEAKARATARILRTKRTLQVAEFRCSDQALRVNASWHAGAVELDLVAHSGHCVRSWTGTQEEMERAFRTELTVAARNCLGRSSKPGNYPMRLVICSDLQVDAATGLPKLDLPSPEKDPRWVKFMLEEQRKLASARPRPPQAPDGSHDR